MSRKLSSKSRTKLVKKEVGNIFSQDDIPITEQINLYAIITDILSRQLPNNREKIMHFLEELNIILAAPNNIFDDIAYIIRNFSNTINFQSKIFIVDDKYIDIFGKYDLITKENQRRFITIDPSIVQIMIFDHEDISNDIVYSLKFIIRRKGLLTLRYTTQLFPEDSRTNLFNDLSGFNAFNKNLGNSYITQHYDEQLLLFIIKYIKFYNFYKKCYLIDEICDNPEKKPIKSRKKLIDYQLKYISILGKARFGNENIKARTAVVTDYVMSNLIFASPTYAFISGGYKGFKDDKYGITRSGYEVAKKYNRPILTIMCKEGMQDSHEYSDAMLIYGEHWGEDSIALSQLTDGAIIIAPFGGWTYIECLTLLANKKIVGIYNDLYNILNYEAIRPIPDDEMRALIEIEKTNLYNISEEEIIREINNKFSNKSDNINFFNFSITEQNNIIDYYINYYLILIYICEKRVEMRMTPILNIANFIALLELGIKMLKYLKILLLTANKIVNAEFALLIKDFNILKTSVNEHIKKNILTINIKYFLTCRVDSEYQTEIPEKCDGIWIKPIFNLIDSCIKEKTSQEDCGPFGCVVSGGKKSKCKKSGGTIDETITAKLDKYEIDRTALNMHPIFENLNNNIIFVFSDVMYLNMYLNKNLNTSFFQKKIHTKINNLLNTPLTRDGTIQYAKNLLKEDAEKNIVHLNRSIDGILNKRTKKISNEHIIRDKYSFIINDKCNNFSSMLEKSDPAVMLGENNQFNSTRQALSRTLSAIVKK